MNIHRELAKYRLVCIRTHEQLMRLREVQQENQSNGAGPSWDAEVESAIYCALESVERTIHNDICDSFEDRENPPNKAMDGQPNTTMILTEQQWTVLLAGLSLGDVNDRPRFVAYDEAYCLSIRDCRKMAQQLVRHFDPPNVIDQPAGATAPCQAQTNPDARSAASPC